MNVEASSPYLFIGGKGRVYALLKSNGSTMWELELKRGGFLGMKSGSSFVTLVEGLTHVYAFAYETAFCINKDSGHVAWQYTLKELEGSIASLTVDATLLGAAARSTSGSNITPSAASLAGPDSSDGSDTGGDPD